MAKFEFEVPNELMQFVEKLSYGDMTEEMVKEGGKVVLEKVKTNMKKAFKTTKSLEQGLRMTRVYKTPSDDGVNVYIGFYGYADSDYPVSITSHNKKGKAYTYIRSGVPIPLIAMAREYGTSRGEQKKPFMRQSFKKSEIESVMKRIQDKYIKGD